MSFLKQLKKFKQLNLSQHTKKSRSKVITTGTLCFSRLEFAKPIRP
jgi:hypothetical protein